MMSEEGVSYTYARRRADYVSGPMNITSLCSRRRDVVD